MMETTLQVQYRMHPAIRQVASSLFYNDKLTEDAQKMPDCRIPQPRYGQAC